MALKLAVSTRNARLDAIEAEIGLGPTLQILSGAEPADCAATDPGVVLAEIILPNNWLNNAASGQKTKAGPWQDTAPNANGTAGHFRIYSNPGGTVCKMQGLVTNTGGGGDMTLDTTSILTTQPVVIGTFTLRDANE